MLSFSKVYKENTVFYQNINNQPSFFISMAYSSLRIDANTLNLLKEIKASIESEYVKPLSFDFVLKKIIEKEERRIIILN